MKDLMYILACKPLYRELFSHEQVFDYKKIDYAPVKF